MTALPKIDGEVLIRSSAERFLQAFRQRVRAGLLSGQPHPRSHYVVSDDGPDHLVVRAADWLSAINVGLNRVEIRHVPPGLIRYHVQYWQWAQYVLGLSGGLGFVGAILLLTLDVRGYIARHQGAMIPGLSSDESLLLAWVMVVFWGFVWPWLLISLHKAPLRRFVTRLIAEVDVGPASPAHR